MPERRFANSYEIDIKKLCSYIIFQMLQREKYDFFNSEDEERVQALEERINNIMALDEKFKNEFIDDMQLTMCSAAQNAFENGLQIGLSLLHHLLTAALPEIHTVRHEPSRTERRCRPVHQQSDVNQTFIDYIKKVMPYLKDEQIYTLQGRTEYFLEKNIKEYLDIF